MGVSTSVVTKSTDLRNARLPVSSARVTRRQSERSVTNDVPDRDRSAESGTQPNASWELQPFIEFKNEMKLPPIFIPPRTRAELASPAPPGQRHEQIKKVVLPLLGAGITPDAVFVQLRQTYDADVSDHEIRNLIAWATSRNPQPCGYGRKNRARNIASSQPPRHPERPTADQAIANALKWLGEFRRNECDLWHVSPWRPLEDWRFDALMLFAGFYDKADFINVVTDFTLEQKDGEQKANPKGAGRTLLRDEWMRWIRDHGAPYNRAGAWIRPNPVQKRGSGKDGAITDADVASYRFCLLESDALPTDLQLSLWARLPLPIAAIITSGGRSVHAWIMLNCSNSEEYREKVNRVHTLLGRFGICPSNKNPSRLSRLPGAQREIGKHGDGAQRLLYLNPEPLEAPIFERSNR